MTFRSRPYLDLCRDRPCIACGADDGTIVPAHRNVGKGMSIKASDAWVIPLCHECHTDFDAGKWNDLKFLNLYAQHIDNLLTEGRLTIDGKPQKEKQFQPIPKILPRNKTL